MISYHSTDSITFVPKNKQNNPGLGLTTLFNAGCTSTCIYTQQRTILSHSEFIPLRLHRDLFIILIYYFKKICISLCDGTAVRVRVVQCSVVLPILNIYE